MASKYLTERAKEYIINSKELLENDDFDAFFKNCMPSERGCIMNFFKLECQIDPLKYMKRIYTWNFKEYEGAVLVIPDNIEAIGIEAFKNCINIVSITIPEHIDRHRISASAFKSAENIHEVKIPKALQADMKPSYIGIKTRANGTKVTWY